MAVLVGGTYASRRAIAHTVLEGWLSRYGIEADIRVDRLDLDGFSGTILVGNADQPDIHIDKIDVDYAIGMPWSKEGLGIKPSVVRLHRPVVSASLADGRFSLGALDKLIEELTSKPSTTETAGPVVIVEKGEARLQTDYGPLTILADARLNGSRLENLVARLPVTGLDGANLKASNLSAEVTAHSLNDRLIFKGVALSEGLQLGGLDALTSGEGLRSEFEGSVAYAEGSGFAGPADFKTRLLATVLKSGDLDARQMQADLVYRGAIASGDGRLALDGDLNGRLDAAALSTGGNRLRNVQVNAPDMNLTVERKVEDKAATIAWQADGATHIIAADGRAAGFAGQGLNLSTSRLLAGGNGSAVEVRAPLEVRITRVTGSDLTLQAVQGRLDLDVVRDSAMRVDLSGSLNSARASYAAMGPVRSDDVPELAQWKQALADFAFDAPSIRLVSGSLGTEMALLQPATLRPRTGGEVVLKAHNAPLLAISGRDVSGAALLQARGGQLPELDLDVTRWRSTGNGLQAQVKARTLLDFGPATGVSAITQGLLVVAGGQTRFVASDCANLAVSRFSMGTNDISDIQGRLCSPQVPLFHMADGQWKLGGQLVDTTLNADFLQMQLSQAHAGLNVSGTRAGLALDVAGIDGLVTDTLSAARFHAVQARGRLSMAADRMTGAFNLALQSDPSLQSEPSQPLATLCLGHDLKSTIGGLGIVTSGADCVVPSGFGAELPKPAGGLVFAQNGLQPKYVSPMVPALVGEPVTGRVAFVGQMIWGQERLESTGHIELREASFVTPLGTLKNGSGDIHLDSLAPVIIPSGQVVQFDEIDGPLPFGRGHLEFGMDAEAIYLRQASVQLADGEAYLYDAGNPDTVEKEMLSEVSEVAMQLPPKISEQGLKIPIGDPRPWQFGVALQGVQLNALIKALGAENKAQLDAEISGVLPVLYRPSWGFAISEGVLVADRRGSLAIAPEVLGNVEAGVGQVEAQGGEVAPVSRNIMQDLAYQALEHLTFTSLRADVNSLCLPQAVAVSAARSALVDITGTGEFCHQLDDDRIDQWPPSRLALDFKIYGYYDPPEKREMRLPLLDFLRGDFMKKKMVLPSDTPVELGLKVSLNAYDLASQVMDYVRDMQEQKLDE